MFIPDPDLDFLFIPDPGIKRPRIPDPDPQNWWTQNEETSVPEVTNWWFFSFLSWTWWLKLRPAWNMASFLLRTDNIDIEARLKGIGSRDGIDLFWRKWMYPGLEFPSFVKIFKFHLVELRPCLFNESCFKEHCENDDTSSPLGTVPSQISYIAWRGKNIISKELTNFFPLLWMYCYYCTLRW